MTDDRQTVIAPPREDASHCPPLAIRPLTLRAWPSHPEPILNDTLADAIEAEDDILLLDTPAPADNAAMPPAPRRSIATAVYGLAASLVLAVVYLIAR